MERPCAKKITSNVNIFKWVFWGADSKFNKTVMIPKRVRVKKKMYFYPEYFVLVLVCIQFWYVYGMHLDLCTLTLHVENSNKHISFTSCLFHMSSMRMIFFWWQCEPWYLIVFPTLHFSYFELKLYTNNISKLEYYYLKY